LNDDLEEVDKLKLSMTADYGPAERKESILEPTMIIENVRKSITKLVK
jgi:hypothetical protein